MSRPEGDSNPNLRIHAECSYHLTYQGQLDICRPMYLNTGSGDIDIFKEKLT